MSYGKVRAWPDREGIFRSVKNRGRIQPVHATVSGLLPVLLAPMFRAMMLNEVVYEATEVQPRVQTRSGRWTQRAARAHLPNGIHCL